MHPVLAPGTHLLRRGAAESQVGLGPGSPRVDGPPQDLVTLLGDRDVLTLLLRSGLAAPDDRPLRTALPAPAADPWLRHTLSALARRSGAALTEVLGHRSAAVIDVVPFGHPVSRSLAEDLDALCRRTGLSVTARRPGVRPRRPRHTLPVHVLLGVGEPSRELVDPWVRDGEPHLLVRLVEGRAVVGPFVVPGRTACLRCTDAYLREDDPVWPLLVEQYARATRSDRADGIPEPADAALAAVAVGWAARDLATYAEGGDPASLSRTVTFSPGLDSVERREWPPHPHCGCAW